MKKNKDKSDSSADNQSANVKRRGIKDKLGRVAKRAPNPPARITNDNIIEHRQAVLARGGKLKYPIQYSKNRLLINSAILVVVALVVFSGWLYVALYKQQQLQGFYYSITKMMPFLNVADVDGASVRYQDYLRRIGADIHYYLNIEKRSFASDEGRHELDYHKRKNLAVAERMAYVRHLADQKNISVNDEEVDKKIEQLRVGEGNTEEQFVSTLSNYYGWTLDDLRYTIADQMYEQKVAYEIDDKAKDRINEVEKQLKAGGEFEKIAKESSDDQMTKANGGIVTTKTDAKDPTGILQAVSKLKPGEVTGIERAQIDGANYYYIAKLVSKDEKQTKYGLIAIKLNKLDEEFNKLKKDGKIHEYITVPSEDSFQSNQNSAK